MAAQDRQKEGVEICLPVYHGRTVVIAGYVRLSPGPPTMWESV